MKVVTHFEIPTAADTPVMLAAGFFDGVHRGHKAVLQSAIDAAHRAQGEAWVLTFDRHPLSVITTAPPPLLLTTSSGRLSRFEALGFDGCIQLAFTETLAAIPAQHFVRQLNEGIPTLAGIFVGPNWRFGKDAEGSPTLLRLYGHTHGFAVTVVGPVNDEKGIISSTRIREAVQAGLIREANQLLGSRYHVNGTIVEGRHIGRELGYPTANLVTHNAILPPCGIYAGYAKTGEKPYPALLYIGHRETFKNETRPPEPVLEIHLLEFNGNLYGRDLQFLFVARIREDRGFDSREALIAQINRDVARARTILED